VGTPATAVTDREGDILRAACRVVLRDGAHGLRMAAVAREAEVSKALVHYYFPTRQELLRAAFAYSGEHWDESVGRELARAPNGRSRLERFLLASVDQAEPFGDHRSLWNEVWSSLRVDAELRPLVHDAYETWVKQIVGLIGAAKKDGSVPSAVDSRAAGWRLAATVDGLDSMLYLGLVDRGRARRLVRQSLERELTA
jgi:AcrR family transcriptional regulator